MILGAIGTTMSAIGSWIPSLWGDEAASLMSAERSLPSLFSMLGVVDAVHGTYYLGLHAWIGLVGTSPFAIRFPSAVATGLTVVAVTLIASRLSSRRVAVVAGIVCCILPRVTYMGAEARSYAFSAAIAAWLTYVLVQIISRQHPSRRWWIGYAALLAVGTYVFLYTVLLVVVHGLILLAVRTPKDIIRRWMVAVGVAVLAAAPVVVWAILERDQISYLDNTTQVTFTTLAVSLWFGNPEFAIVAWAFIAVAIVAAVRLWLRERTSAAPDESLLPTRMPSLTLVGVAWLLIPTVILIAAHVAIPVFTARYLSYCAPAAAILIACGLGWLGQRNRWILLVGTAIVVGAAVPAYVSQRGPYSQNNSDWAEISSIVGAHAQQGDAIAFDETARPSRRPRLALHTYPDGFTKVRDVALNVPFTRNTTWHDSAYNIATAASLGRLDGVHRIWLVEYATPQHVDTYDVAQLRDLGFVVSAKYTTYRSVIYEYVDGTVAP
ncbi:MAG: hypothetical protein JWO18_1909 [Microbacteriaceae bacterium]|nr:hypothetical protein [Microbacteriaceae bacterium]